MNTNNNTIDFATILGTDLLAKIQIKINNLSCNINGYMQYIAEKIRELRNYGNLDIAMNYKKLIILLYERELCYKRILVK